ncbi:hypothetical protein ACIBCM_08995 [Streptomyces sp. NPDC051018]
MSRVRVLRRGWTGEWRERADEDEREAGQGTAFVPLSVTIAWDDPR